MKKRLFTMALGIVLLMSSLTGCGSSSDSSSAETGSVSTSEVSGASEASGTPEGSEEAAPGTEADSDLPLAGEHYIFAGYDAFKPFRYIEVQPDGTQKVVGLDIAVADELAKRLGFTYEFSAMPFASILASVESGQADFSFGFTYNEDREKIYDFTQGYFQPRVGIVGKEGLNIESIDDISDMTIGVVTGTVQHTMVQELLPDANIQTYDTSDLCLQELLSNRIDCYLCDGAEAIEMAEPHDGIEAYVLDKDFSSEYLGEYHCMAWKGAPFIELFDQTLTEMKEEGTLDELITEWVGADFTWN